jgi:hypothetical protein
MTAARLQRLADSVSGEALLCPAGGEIRRLLQSAWGALDEAARLAEERERRERSAEQLQCMPGDPSDFDRMA